MTAQSGFVVAIQICFFLDVKIWTLEKMKEEMVDFGNQIHINLNTATDEQQR